MSGRERNVLECLHRDHQELRLWLEEVRMCGGDRMVRERLFRKLREELLVHILAEEKSVYLRLREYEQTRAAAESALEKNDEILALVEELSQLPTGTEEWRSCFEPFEAAVLKQFEEEESNIFPHAQALLPSLHLDVLREIWEDRKQLERTLLTQLRNAA